MQYEPALSEMEVILKKDYEKYYWQQIFCFGKMGDKAVSFLLKRIDHSNKNIRFASIMLLGYLTAEEAAKPLIAQYRKEKDPLVRKDILSSLERVMPDLNEMENFFKEAAAKEQDKDVKTFADETIANLNTYRQKINEAKAKKKNDRESFEKTYNSLYKGYGHDGSYETLAACSQFDDEQRLKKLRERVLFRNSDECFYDYQKINEIIMFNRFIANTR
jgi:hypothetical protein